jgi:hypothetical protein
MFLLVFYDELAFSMRINYAAMQKGYACVFMRFSKQAASSNLHLVAKEEKKHHMHADVYTYLLLLSIICCCYTQIITCLFI